MSSLSWSIFFLLLPLASTQKPGCPTHCGKVSIPYPFGIGLNCSLEKSFSITCNSTSKPYLNISDKSVEVVEISLDNPAQIRIQYPHLLYGSCRSRSLGNKTWSDGNYVYLVGSPYSLSEDNWLTTVGCDDFIASTSYVGDEGFPDACVGFCSVYNNSTNKGYCPNNIDMNSVGKGCCRTPIPKGCSYLVAQLVDLSRSWNRTRVFPCSYAFVKEKGNLDKPGYSYNYSILMQNSTAFLKNKLSVVRLDWRIGDKNCSRARWNSSYVCQSNTRCVDFSAKVGGYLCNCSDGYEGNPYLYPGCTDINECDENPCVQHSHCINTPGSFNCSCRKGYTGDGKSKGSGCSILPPSNIIQIFLIGLGSTIGLLLLLLLCFWLRRVIEKRKKRKCKEDLFKHLLLQQQTNEGTFGKTKLFTAKELAKATDNFNESRICGQGGQGVVYKGMLSDGMIVAIKKVKQVDENQVE